MTEKRVRWNPNQRKTIARGQQSIVDAFKLAGTLAFGSDRAVKQLAGEVVDDVRGQVERRRARDGAIDTTGEPVRRHDADDDEEAEDDGE